MTGVRRFLVTAPTDLRMDLWAVTAMMTNWIEGRDAGRSRQTWLVMCAGNPSGFLDAAGRIGVTVEEIRGSGDHPTYDLLVGAPGTGWASSYWESRRSRRTLGGISGSWPQFGEPACGDVAPCPDAECSRKPGHSGRHMASLGGGWGHRIIAAWPGTTAPVKGDL